MIIMEETRLQRVGSPPEGELKDLYAYQRSVFLPRPGARAFKGLQGPCTYRREPNTRPHTS